MLKIRKNCWLFPASKNSNGITSWWIDNEKEPILIDCPPIDESVKDNLYNLAAGRSPKIILTSRDAHANFKKLRECFSWDALVQEQESYLLPGMKGIKTFSEEYKTISGLRLFWTPGPTPGSCIAYAPAPSNVLFCGRLLIPVATDRLVPLRTKKTFHWSMQLNSLRKMRNWIPPNSFPGLASGGNVNLLTHEKILPWHAWEGRHK